MSINPVIQQRRTNRAGGFSLLEIMIAIGVLGIGLIMVAAIFPVALTQHRDSIEKSRSLDLVNKAEALLRSRLDASRLWVDPLTPAGTDSAWFMLPMSNLAVGSNGPNAWDWMAPRTTPFLSAPSTIGPGLSANDYLNYANCLNFAYNSQPGNAFSLFAMPSLEMLSDRKAPTYDAWSPMNDAEFESSENRFAWVGFYRRLAAGTTRYTVAVNRILRDERYAEQDPSTIGTGDPGIAPMAGGTPRRLPVPWRVTVQYNPLTHRIYNNANPEGLGELAPAGSRIMVGGFVWPGGPITPPVPTLPTAPAGRILTVTNVFDFNSDGVDEAVDFLEDPTGLPAAPYFFDVIVFPPPYVAVNGTNVQFGKKSPLIQWKVNL